MIKSLLLDKKGKASMKNLNYIKKFKGISFRLFLSFFLLLSLFLVKQFAVQNQLVQEENTSETINTAGRQRMLSQKITKEITFLQFGDEANLEEINENLTLFIESQEDLIKRGKKDQLVRKEDALILNLYQELAVDFEGLVKATGNYLREYQKDRSNPSQLESYFQEIKENEAFFLKKMDEIVFTYEGEGREALVFIRILNLSLFALIILILIYVIFRVFRPLMNSALESYEHNKTLQRDLRHILMQLKGVLFLVDLKGNILFMNDEAKAFFHELNLEDSASLSIDQIDWINFDMKEYIEREGKTEEDAEEIEILLESTSGELVPFSLSFLSGVYDGQEALILTMYDLSKQKIAEEILKRMAIHDELTGLYNRYILENILEKEFAQADRYDMPVSISILDLDHFKRVNDEYGHPVGDAVLKGTAEIIQKTIRASDYAVRIGGEEILIFMPNTRREEGKVLLEKLRLKLSKHEHPKVGVVSASFGLVERRREEDYVSVYNRVDDALYIAKENGRNRVEIL